MSLLDLLLLCGIAVTFFFLGRASMMHSLIKAVIEEAENEENPIAGSGELTIEKINDIYYAYVGTDFAGQADNFDDLIGNMVKEKRFKKFRMSGADNLSVTEQQSLAQALKKNFSSK